MKGQERTKEGDDEDHRMSQIIKTCLSTSDTHVLF